MGGPTYRQGIAGQVRVPRRRPIRLSKRMPDQDEESLERDRYFPLE
jgi:hypothetical protein